MDNLARAQNSLVDTHCHLLHMLGKEKNSSLSHHDFQELSSYIQRANESGVTTIIEVATTIGESNLVIEIAKNFKQTHPVIGIHPCEATADWRHEAEQLTALMKKHNHLIVGVGECGFDKYHPGYTLAYQTDLFQYQIELALQHNKALVVHTRDAQDETYRMLERYKNDLKRVTIHCYSNDLDFAQEVTSWGFKLGIGGTVTYPKNNLLRMVVQTVGLEHIVLETDSPFLAPQAVRGTPNGPQNIKLIADYVAHLLQVPFEKVAEITTANARALFYMCMLIFGLAPAYSMDTYSLQKEATACMHTKIVHRELSDPLTRLNYICFLELFGQYPQTYNETQLTYLIKHFPGFKMVQRLIDRHESWHKLTYVTELTPSNCHTAHARATQAASKALLHALYNLPSDTRADEDDDTIIHYDGPQIVPLHYSREH